MKLFEALMLADDSSCELRMYGRIGKTLFDDGITAGQVGEALAKAPNARTLNVKLSSPGGAVFEGMAIRSMLSAHPAKVIVDVEGLAASAGSVIAMSGDTIRMHEGAAFMLHDSRIDTMGGNIAAHKRAIAAMESINDGAAAIYAMRSGLPKERVVQLMNEETWLTPAQAKELGFIDEVVPGKSAPARMYFDLGSYGYQNVPPHIAAQLAAVPPRAREKTTMGYERIAMALGLNADGAEEAAVLAAVTGMQTRLRSRDALLGELRTLTGKQDEAEMLGAVRGMAEGAAQVVLLTQQNTALTKQVEDSERAALIAADAVDAKGRKLTPALAKHFETRSAAELRAFLEVAPHVVVVGGQPAKQPGASVTLEPGGAPPPAAPVLFEGKKWEELTAMAKHNLHEENLEMYDALRADYIARRPAS